MAGIGSTTVITGTQIVVADVATPANRGRMMSTYQGFFSFAVGVGPSVGGLVAVLAGPRAPFFVFAVLTLVAGAVALTQLPETGSRRAVTALGGAKAPPPAGSGVVRRLLTNVGFLCVSLVTFQAAFTRTGAIFSVVPLAGVERIGLGAAAIGLAITAGNLLNLATIAAAGMLVDRYGRKPVIVPSCLLSAAAFAGFAYAMSYPAFVLSAVLWGIGSALGGSTAAYAADQAPPGGNGVTMGIYRMLSDAGYIIGPAMMGIIAERSGTQSALLTAAVIAIVAMVPFALLAPETRPRPRAAGAPA